MKGSTEGELLLRCADAVQDCQKDRKPHRRGASGGLLGVLLDRIRRRWRRRQ
ncbi:hypothetical protein FB599_0415 [Herbaspirillum sp. SJZ130]|nr:hypothetical protein [Herbaspirillum sp. SJZ102]TQK13008.1 hypothetical protein FB599_0415 [Herbaspirillum sp. SJZ130]TQK15012.1 hypothetical protein FB598_0353 [Herbaspirillum sp. SJZ106]TWC67368.1 hypothetical protein FB597_104178 [Herbaspirillum sp. SJZ099]